MLYAHTPNDDGQWHALADHLENVATLAAGHAAAFGSADAAWWAGILHDAGKASVAFQDYLRLCFEQPNRKHTTVDHKGAGFLRALEILQPLAIPIQGHHGGLNDAQTIGTKVKEHRDRAALLQEALTRFDGLGLIAPDWPKPMIPEFARRNELALEFWVRMLFSALVDADHFDTERHKNPDASARRGSDIQMSDLWEQFERNQQAFIEQLSPEQVALPVNRVRADVYRACLAAAAHQPGFFRLTVPTGGGKTRSGLAFALKHAELHGLRRVILAVPYLTITDQTARIVRSIFPGDRVLLEHHSAAGSGGNDSDDGPQDEQELWRRSTAQDWDAPIIVTTMVQLFESLLGRKTGVCRKLHRIAGSVIVLDEAQTIPITLREPIYDVLRELVEYYGVSVVLCTATQPARSWLPAEVDPVEIVPDPARHFRTLQRVDYSWPETDDPAWSWDETAEVLRERPQTLVIVNTVADAASLFEALGDDDGHFHLSSRMCGAHRRDVVDTIRARLADGLPCRVVSTQVVEAGVDLDFPLLLRAMGPLDRIVQAAGRCNREGKLPGKGQVMVFRPAEGGMPPGAYRTGTDTTQLLREMVEDQFDLDDPAIFDRYFTMLARVTAADAPEIQQDRARLNYETVANNFHLIDDQDQVSVLARYRGLDWDPYDGAESRVDGLVTEIEQAVTARNSAWLRGLLRKAQPYLVNVRRRILRDYERNGDVRPLTEDLWLWLPQYDASLGLVSGRLDVAQLIVG